jgi:hypothetical protein
VYEVGTENDEANKMVEIIQDAVAAGVKLKEVRTMCHCF